MLVGIQNVLATLENNFTFPYKKIHLLKETKVSCQVKEGTCERVHIIQCHLYEIIEWQNSSNRKEIRGSQRL